MHPRNVIAFAPRLRGARLYDLHAARHHAHPEPTLGHLPAGGIQLEGWIDDGVIIIFAANRDGGPGPAAPAAALPARAA